MKKNNKGENKACFILHSISAILFGFTGVMILIEDGFKDFKGISNIGLAITFASLAIIYYKRYKEDK